MSEDFSVTVPEEQKEILKVKEEDLTWEQKSSQTEENCLTQETFRQRFRQFCYQKTTKPQEALSQLWVLCSQWLRPEVHTKEEMMELLVLEQFLTILPQELQASVKKRLPQNRAEVITLLEELEQQSNKPGQQTSVLAQGLEEHSEETEHQGASQESQSLQVKCESQDPNPLQESAVTDSSHHQEDLPRDETTVSVFNSAQSQTSVKTEEDDQFLVSEDWQCFDPAEKNTCGNVELKNLDLLTGEVMIKDGMLLPKPEISKEAEPQEEVSSALKRDCSPQILVGPPVQAEKNIEFLNTLKDRNPGDLWSRMHISSMEYAAGDITRKDRKKDKARVSELLQGLTFSGDSDVDEEDEVKSHPARKKQKVTTITEKKWIKRDIQPNFPTWSALDSEILNLKNEKLNPVDFFELFFDDETFKLIVDETNHYASQKNVTLEVTVQEMKCVFGVLLLSGYICHPKRGMYWESSDKEQSLVSNAIRRERFELIFSYLHFADNSCLNQSDKFTKLRPLIDQMNKNFLLHAPLEEYYCFDKSMCECFDSDQFLNGKPIRIGYKIWCGATSQGYLVWFEPYQGEPVLKEDKDYDLGLGGKLVMNFADVLLERGQHPYHICFDNFFTSIKLISALKKKGVKATGAIRDNRTEKCPFMNAENMKKMKRGSFDFRVEEKEEIILCRWNDENSINLCSNAVGIEPMSQVSYSVDEKRKVQVNQPSIVKLYEVCRYGVAKMDQNISKYRIRIRSKKWYSILVSYIIDVAINNAWHLYRICSPDTPSSLLDFRRRIARFYLENNANLAN
ncbi:piggyBac transposable element-derived protein 1 [Sarcophilus harrisii]|uniref:PiggyBac transposable element derived 1 n=1 Tax=Sarcophilus harrisii TaxID=9305 RepID=G3VPU6_SARHA|nr:piggyBac transposable element-derived protein 1 [Sarcophilus harrisii]XP_023359666.1 piggyBac transposable element-derived protein 1 [Sarcophilus harrisii]XP_031824288.1 piggyBac transposable element-derived protein 1 [Sarcophilus harrisii]XP_031824289.1 piggyBac transposable element-derived protein 1 [Sarcophilus harrisii]